MPNPSFEDTVGCCPTGLGPLLYVADWDYYRGTPDYFSTYHHQYPNVPFNPPGYQWPATGNSYCGLITFSKLSTEEREYIGAKLLNSLTVGQKYYISMKVNCAIEPVYRLNGAYSTNKIGILFSTQSYHSWDTNLVPAPITNYAHIYAENIISDTLEWVCVTGWFIADSTYKYIIIGNFFNDEKTDTLKVIEPDTLGEKIAYYYIDDVCVSVDSLACNQKTEINQSNSLPLFNVYPNPINDYMYIDNNNTQSYNLIIYNVFGQKLYEEKNIVDNKKTIDTTKFRHSMLIISIETKSKIINF